MKKKKNQIVKEHFHNHVKNPNASEVYSLVAENQKA